MQVLLSEVITDIKISLLRVALSIIICTIDKNISLIFARAGTNIWISGYSSGRVRIRIL